MNLKLFALILFTSTLISLSTSFPQEAKDDELDKMRATLDDLAQPPALSLEVVPVDSSGLNPLKKRKELELQPVIFTFVRKRCSGVDVRNCRVREDFAVRVAFPPVLTSTHNASPSHRTIIHFLWYACGISNNNYNFR